MMPSRLLFKESSENSLQQTYTLSGIESKHLNICNKRTTLSGHIPSNERTIGRNPLLSIRIVILFLFGLLVISLVIYGITKVANTLNKEVENILTNVSSTQSTNVSAGIHYVTLFVRCNIQTAKTLAMLTQQLQNISELRVTNIIISDSDVNGDVGNNYKDLLLLIESAKMYNIKISIALDELFTTKEENFSYFPNNLFVKDWNNRILKKNNRKIINCSSSLYESKVVESFEKYRKANITNYVVLNNPPKIVETQVDEHDIFVVSDEIDNSMLLKTSKMIVSKLPNINLFYSYDLKYEDKINSQYTDHFSGYVVVIYFDIFNKMITFPRLIFDVLGPDFDGKRKFLFFDICSTKTKSKMNGLFLGLYLFSPNEIILHSEFDWVIDVLNSDYNKLYKQRFQEFVHLKTIDNYFDKNSMVLSSEIFGHSVLAVLRGIFSENKMSNLLIFLYCFGEKTKVPVDKLYNLKKNQELFILTDNNNLNSFNVYLDSLDITLANGQNVVLKVK